jgi:hypothetical protein
MPGNNCKPINEVTHAKGKKKILQSLKIRPPSNYWMSETKKPRRKKIKNEKVFYLADFKHCS